MKNKKINGWKLTAILSLILNGIVAILLVIGLTGGRSYTKTSAYGGYDNNKIITSTQKIDSSIDYYLYYDWENKQVPSSETLYYIPTCNNIENFEFWRALPNNLIYEDEDYYLNVLFIRKTQNRNSVEFTYYGRDKQSGVNGVFRVAEILIQTEPRSIYIDFDTSGVDLTSDSIRTHFKSLFDGTKINLYSDAPSFIIGYFSQYSVQSLSLRQEWNITERINGVNFEGEYNWLYEPQNQNYTFLSNTLIVSKDSAMFNTSITNYSDIGFMDALEGIFVIDGFAYSKLVWVWREAKLNEFETVVYNNYLMDDLAGANDNHYYYLDSLCPYWEENQQVLIEYPIVIMHSDTITSTSNGGQLKNNLKMVIDSNFTNYKVTTLAVQLYSTQQVHFSNLGYLFKWVNNFYWYDGEVFIIDDTDSDISANNNGNIGNVFVVISNAFESLIPILSLMVLPGITLGMLIFLPIIATVIVVIIKIVKR